MKDTFIAKFAIKDTFMARFPPFATPHPSQHLTQPHNTSPSRITKRGTFAPTPVDK